jgi:2-desacetyl-2-hydroxyethyl bacteriochlorophyllide A dehydrogenase
MTSTDLDPRTRRAFWVSGPRQAEIRSESLPQPGPGELSVRTLYTAVSRGTETLVYEGRVPKSEYQRMRAPYQEGEFPGPVKYGYCCVGEVEHGGGALQGRTVFGLFPHQTYTVARDDAWVIVPDPVPASRAVLAANVETAITGIWDARLSIGDRVCVVGGGVIGCLVAYLARRVIGCEVQLLDVDERKRQVAGHLGVEFAAQATVRSGVDVVFDTSGSPAGLQRALELGGLESRVVVMSWFGDGPVELALGGAFHAERLKLISSQVGRIPAHQRARWTHRRRLELALQLLADDALDALFTGEIPFEELPRAMATLSDRSSFALCQRVVYR